MMLLTYAILSAAILAGGLTSCLLREVRARRLKQEAIRIPVYPVRRR
ncbi:MAG: hypothetical protein VXZ05_02390 [Pseudomonadota bacterium]|nr:hypothetical protein [Pseudomonadota bacterium]